MGPLHGTVVWAPLGFWPLTAYQSVAETTEQGLQWHGHASFNFWGGGGGPLQPLREASLLGDGKQYLSC